MKEKQKTEGPQKVKGPFLKDKGIIARIKATIKREGLEDKKELKEPILFLIKDNGYTEILEGVTTGEFDIMEKGKLGGGEAKKCVYLTPDKLTTFRYGSQYYKGWVAYENEAFPYPHDPIRDAEMFRKVTQKLSMNWRDREEAKAWEGKGKFILIAALALIMVVSVLSNPQIASQVGALLAEEAPKAVANATVAIANNTTTPPMAVVG